MVIQFCIKLFFFLSYLPYSLKLIMFREDVNKTDSLPAAREGKLGSSNVTSQETEKDYGRFRIQAGLDPVLTYRPHLTVSVIFKNN